MRRASSKTASASGEPVFIAQRGRASPVLVSTRAYERTQHKVEILRPLARGEADSEAGIGYDLDGALRGGYLCASRVPEEIEACGRTPKHEIEIVSARLELARQVHAQRTSSRKGDMR
jgi:PHD/YefM family antitoxin component YafN of YafNO toxin-antitoxin module